MAASKQFNWYLRFWLSNDSYLFRDDLISGTQAQDVHPGFGPLTVVCVAVPVVSVFTGSHGSGDEACHPLSLQVEYIEVHLSGLRDRVVNPYVGAGWVRLGEHLYHVNLFECR